MYKGLLPGVPRIESLTFPVELPHYGLNEVEQEIAQQLHARGFAVIDFNDPQFDDRVERIRASLGPRFGLPLDDPESDKTLGERRIQDAWKFDEDVRAIAANVHILDLLSRLYGRQAFPFQTLNFPVGTQQDLHTDSVHFSSLPERFMCGVWVAMENVTAAAGPLFYLPGSHKWPIVSNVMLGRHGFGSKLDSAQAPYGAAWQGMIEASDSAPETFLARKGQALIWCANLLHGGAVQTDPRLTRWSQVTHYYFEDCIYYTPAYSDEVLGRLDMRGVTDVSNGQRRQHSYMGTPLQDKKLPFPKRHPQFGIGQAVRNLFRG